MTGTHASRWLMARALVITLTALATACVLLPPSTPAPTLTTAPNLRLSANTMLVMGGNRNPTGLAPRMQQELGGNPWFPQHSTNPLTPGGVFGRGYIDTENNPDSPYAGWDFTLVHWPAEISLPIFGWTTFAESQRLGQAALHAAVTTAAPRLDTGEQMLIFGYSSSANVAVRVMRDLQQQGGPNTDRLSFALLGNPNRPNGGFLQRFTGLHIPVLDIDFDGTTPIDTPYPTTDISWEYDAAADFPTYPLNLLAVLNSLIGGSVLHGNYFRADIAGERAFPDTTVGNVTYITLEPPHLPLLLPLYDLGFPAPLLELVEPALTVMVDWGYDRTIGPGTPQTARLLPRIDPAAAAADLAESIVRGVRNAAAALIPEQGAPGDPDVRAARGSTAPTNPRHLSKRALPTTPPARLDVVGSGDQKSERPERQGRAGGGVKALPAARHSTR